MAVRGERKKFQIMFVRCWRLAKFKSKHEFLIYKNFYIYVKKHCVLCCKIVDWKLCFTHTLTHAWAMIFHLHPPSLPPLDIQVNFQYNFPVISEEKICKWNAEEFSSFFFRILLPRFLPLTLRLIRKNVDNENATVSHWIRITLNYIVDSRWV